MQKALRLAKKTIGKSFTNPQGLVSLKSTDGGNSIVIETFGDTTSLKCVIPSQVQMPEKGKVDIPVDKFLQILDVVEGPIHIQPNGNSIKIESGGTKFSIHKMALNMREEEFSPVISVPVQREQFLNKIKTASMYTGDTQKPILEGVNLKIEPGKITVAGTNGHYLYVSSISADIEVKEKIELTLPKESIASIIEAGVLAQEEEMFISLGEQNTAFRVELFDPEITIQGTTLQGTFPDYDSIMEMYPRNKDGASLVNLERNALVTAIRRLSLVGDVIKVDIENNRLSAESESGSGQESIEFKGKTGGTPPILGFSSTYFRTVLQSLNSKDITIVMYGDAQPIRIDEEGTTILLMPVRLSD